MFALLIQSVLSNGDFGEWRDGVPAGWEVRVGAANGEGPESAIDRAEGGVSLRGDADTRVWRMLAQDVEAAEGDAFRLSFESRAVGLNREGTQNVNHYVGLVFVGTDTRLFVSAGATWRPDEIVARAPKGTTGAEAWIFLSQTGALEVRDVSLERPAADDAYDVLVRHMDRYYSYFEHRGIDWPALAKDHRGDIRALLAELRDPHVWIEGQEPLLAPTAERNFDYAAVAKRLSGAKQIGKIGFVGRVDGLGVVAVGSLMGPDEHFAELEAEIEKLFDAPGILLDLRANVGGAEVRAQRIAAMFADRERVYARSTFRAGAAHDAFTPPAERRIAPREGATYTKPVVCLIGPGCVSSGEGFALMMDALPHVTLVGRPTRGASGNPQPVELPDGTTVWFSRWVAMRADGTVLEGEGVGPDVDVEHEGEGDSTFERGVEELKTRARDR